MSILEHFKDQPVHQRDGIDHWYVLTDKYGAVEVCAVPIAEIETFLEGTAFAHKAGMIPRFNKPATQGKWTNPLANKTDGKS